MRINKTFNRTESYNSITSNKSLKEIPQSVKKKIHFNKSIKTRSERILPDPEPVSDDEDKESELCLVPSTSGYNLRTKQKNDAVPKEITISNDSSFCSSLQDISRSDSSSSWNNPDTV